MAYNAAQLQDILRSVGWPEDLIVAMAAIGLAESSGRPDAVNRLGEYSVGLWQININPSLRRPWTEQQLRDPYFNAQIALQLYNERQAEGRRNGLTHWGAYTDGRYRAYMNASQQAYNGGGTGVPPVDVGNGYTDDYGTFFPSENQTDLSFGGFGELSTPIVIGGLALVGLLLARRIGLI